MVAGDAEHSQVAAAAATTAQNMRPQAQDEMGRVVSVHALVVAAGSDVADAVAPRDP